MPLASWRVKPEARPCGTTAHAGRIRGGTLHRVLRDTVDRARHRQHMSRNAATARCPLRDSNGFGLPPISAGIFSRRIRSMSRKALRTARQARRIERRLVSNAGPKDRRAIIGRRRDRRNAPPAASAFFLTTSGRIIATSPELRSVTTTTRGMARCAGASSS